MEKITIISGKNLYNEHYKFLLEQDVEYQRLKFYKGIVYEFQYSSKKETDTHIYWSTSSKFPMFENDKLFFKHKTICGASYDKKSNKIKIWFGYNINRLPEEIQTDIFQILVPWFVDSTNPWIRNNYQVMMTNGILNKMIKGSITSTEGIIKAFCKYNPYKTFNLDTKKLDLIFTQSAYYNIKQFKYIFLASENPNDVVGYIYDNMKTSNYIYNQFIDISKTALSIGEKINVNWNKDELLSKNMEFLNHRKDLETIYSSVLGLEKPQEDLPF